MTASVIQLQARGAQDIYLNIDPEVRAFDASFLSASQ